jgi:hypothetical protein
MKGINRGLGATGPRGPKGCTGDEGEFCNSLLGLSTTLNSVSSSTGYTSLKTVTIPRYTLSDLNSVQLTFAAYRCDSVNDDTSSKFRVQITSTSGTVNAGSFSGVSAHIATVTLFWDTTTNSIVAYVNGGSNVQMVSVGTGFDDITVSYQSQVAVVGQQFCSRLMIGDIMGISTEYEAEF